MNKKSFVAFCLKIALLFVILCAVDRVVGFAFVTMKNVGLNRNPGNMWLKTAYIVERVKTDVVIIGSSKATHNYISDSLSEYLHMSVYNCGQDGCFFLYQNCILNMILDRYQPKTILWDVQPNSFTKSTEAGEYQNTRYLTPYYHNSEWAHCYINSESVKMSIRMMSYMYGYNSKLLNYMFPLLTHTSATQHGYTPLSSDGKNYPIMVHEPESDKGQVFHPYLVMLDETLKRCRKGNVNIQLYISPDYSVKNNLTRQAESAIKNVAKRNNVRCFDYHSDISFMRDSTLFKDSGHLNEKGARIFTKMVILTTRNQEPLKMRSNGD